VEQRAVDDQEIERLRENAPADVEEQRRACEVDEATATNAEDDLKTSGDKCCQNDVELARERRDDVTQGKEEETLIGEERESRSEGVERKTREEGLESRDEVELRREDSEAADQPKDGDVRRGEIDARQEATGEDFQPEDVEQKTEKEHVYTARRRF